jgi:hypothetical protein
MKYVIFQVLLFVFVLGVIYELWYRRRRPRRTSDHASEVQP